MSYQALYRKYRPTTFDDVVGQDVAKKTLLNTLKTGKNSHAYLFSGPRGTGKTSVAKIFAKALNCLSLKNGNPCLKCKNCIESAKRECPDIIEIDAASNNGVDEIRELRNKVSLVPAELKYKVYIIDEVHMLSIGAFNALLKTLEEPPSHVVFILATTDLHKVPITIVSRCQCFSFKRISEKSIIDRLKYISKLENISIDSEVLESIAKYSDGGMRDALGMLDKLVSYTSEHITMEDMREINGLVSEEELSYFIDKIKENDILFVLNQIDFLYQNGRDMIRFVEEMILNLRNQLVHKYLNHDDAIDDSFINEFAIMLNQLLFDLRESNNIRVLLEIRLLKFMNDSSSINNVSKQTFDNNDKLINDEENSTKKEDIKLEEKSKKIPSTEFIEREKVRINNTFALASKKDLLNVKQEWDKLIDYTLDREIGAIACFLTDGTPVAASSKNLILAFDYSSMVERGNDMMERVELAIKKILGHSYHLVFLTKEQWVEEKKKYIQNKNNKVEYIYQDEQKIEEVPLEKEPIKQDEDLTDLTKTAIQLFGKNVVKIDN